MDIVVTGGTVIDGTGANPIEADVAIKGDRIVAVRERKDQPTHWEAKTVIDAKGLILCPGFIDSHTHDDLLLLQRDTRDAKAKISQGVTSVVVGNCGLSLFPLELKDHPELENVPEPLNLLGPRETFRFPTLRSFLDTVAASPPVVNYCVLVGHGALRLRGMNYDHNATLQREATSEELAEMKEWVKEAMEAGAIGMSTGLQYPLAISSSTQEVIELAKVVSSYGGIYATHLRDEFELLEESVEEALTIGKEAGVEVVLSHHKAAKKNNHGKVVRTLARVDEVNRDKKRTEVSLDVYPYTASSTVLRYEFAEGSDTLITWSKGDPSATGKWLASLAEENGVSLREMIERLQPAGAVYFTMSEDDVRKVLSHPMTMVGSDGLVCQVHPHPRLWGTFTRVLGHYCRDEKVLDLSEAIRKMTQLPAQRYGLRDRGVIKEGAFADIVVFDPATVIDSATYASPFTPAKGVRLVLVNGQIAYQSDGESVTTPEDITLLHYNGRHLRREMDSL